MATTQDPDFGWKPSGRPQSLIAQNFMSELDDLFKIDGGLDLLDKNVHQKKQAVTDHTQQLEALQARLKETEERLKEVQNSPPRKDSQRRTPRQDTFHNDDKARLRQHAAGMHNTTDRPTTAQSTGEGRA